MAISGTTATFLARRWGKRHVSGGRSGAVFATSNFGRDETYPSFVAYDEFGCGCPASLAAAVAAVLLLCWGLPFLAGPRAVLPIPRCQSTVNGQSPEMQLAELREYASRRDWEIYDEYVDSGVSGSKESRPELNRLMADVHKRHFDVVLCWKVDRFGSSLKHLGYAPLVLAWEVDWESAKSRSVVASGVCFDEADLLEALSFVQVLLTACNL
jgi:hypothetical protein